MQFGVCGDAGMAEAAAKAGFDFVEGTVGKLLKPRESRDAFRVALEAVRAAGLPCPVVNCFVPGDLKITGPEADPGKLRDYVTATFDRAGQAGVEVVVFGSGGARQIPDGFSREAAHGQLVAFCSMAGPIASDNGVTIAVEPLHRPDCNVLTSVSETAALVEDVAHPAVRLLADSYHLFLEEASCEAVARHAGLLAHVHVATVPNRLVPGAEPCALDAFFEALRQGGYAGRISIEARITDPAAELPAALSALRSLAAE